MRMGSETEFGIANGWTLAKAQAIQSHLVAHRPCLPSVKSGIYVENGARIYVDLQKQNEYATPEVDSPADLVIHELAGRTLMSKAADACGLVLLCSNIDPYRGTTWGTHENYECRQGPIREDLSPLFTHLITRIVFCGAGGIDQGVSGLVPVLSPRACRIVALQERQGVVRKSLVFTKPEDYGPGHRLHLFAGESLLSHAAGYLKYATTALVVAVLDAKWTTPWPKLAQSPLCALREINRDLSLRRRFPLADGRRLTAIEIQRVLMDGISRHTPNLPVWAPEALRHWAAALDDLESDHLAAHGRFDWTIQLDLLHELAQAADIGPQAVAAFNEWQRHDGPSETRKIKLDPGVARLRAAANEIYIRLHMLGKDSLFERICSERKLDHGMPGITHDLIQQAIHVPPPGRAARRASLVSRRHEHPTAALSWDFLLDPQQQRILNIPDEEEPGWAHHWIEIHPQQQINDPEPTFRQGRYKEALAMLAPRMSESIRNLSISELELFCISRWRMGLPVDFAEVSEVLAQLGASRLQVIALELFCRINEGLVPPVDRLMSLICEGEPLAAAEPAGSYPWYVYFQSKGWVLATAGASAEALGVFEMLIAEESNCLRPRMLARTRCYAGEILRRQGKSNQAKTFAEEAFQVHQSAGMMGDMAAHSLPLLARLEEDDLYAGILLTNALHYACSTANDLTQAKVRCLMARRLRCDNNRASIADLFAQVPALSRCPVSRRIQAEWEAWTAGPAGSGPDDYWRIA